MEFSKNPMRWFFGAVFILVITDLIQIYANHQENRVALEHKSLGEALTSLERLSSLVSKAEVTSQNYFLSGQEKSIESLYETTGMIRVRISQLNETLAAAHWDSAQRLSIEKSIEAHLRLLHEQIDIRRFGNGSEPPALAAKHGAILSEATQQELVKLESKLENQIKLVRVKLDEFSSFTEKVVGLGTLLDIFVFSFIFFGFRREIYRRRKVEYDLSESLKHLESSNRSIQEASQLRSRFLAIAAHDLRSPLRQIHQFSEIISEKGDLSEHSKKMLDYIRNGTVQMSALIEDLLEEASLREGRLKLKKQLIDINELIPKLTPHHQAQLSNKKQNLHISNTGACWVEADPPRISQVLDNLVSNAIKYSPPGGHIWIETSADENWVTIRVKDDGLGLASNEIEKIFAPFYRAKAPTAGEPSTGLGLSIAKTMVELHGGKLSAESAGAGRGSTFTVELPRVLQKTNFLPLSKHLIEAFK